jgi:hypothetical protein
MAAAFANRQQLAQPEACIQCKHVLAVNLYSAGYAIQKQSKTTLLKICGLFSLMNSKQMPHGSHGFDRRPLQISRPAQVGEYVSFN